MLAIASPNLEEFVFRGFESLSTAQPITLTVHHRSSAGLISEQLSLKFGYPLSALQQGAIGLAFLVRHRL